ncbi:MAG: menaquinone biosynthesis protein [Chloroflexi bacterium]|nr:menaquinone biosynthesis protein [Chloroflexota bacterium]
MRFWRCTTLRLGEVSYINVLPVYYPFEAGWIHLPVELVRGTPAQLNEWLENEEIDLGSVSSIAYARNHQSLMLLPDLSIACEGSVGSVLLFSKERIDLLDGKRIALTKSSATAAALLKVLCQHYYAIKVEFIEMAPDLSSMLEAADACLLIGDDALRAAKRAEGLVVEDLGKAWWILTGLPMVFGVWAVRRETANRSSGELQELVKAFREAKRLGKENLSTIIDVAASRTGLTVEELQAYYPLQKYELGPSYQRGLLSFYNYCSRMRLAPRIEKLDFFSPS